MQLSSLAAGRLCYIRIVLQGVVILFSSNICPEKPWEFIKAFALDILVVSSKNVF